MVHKEFLAKLLKTIVPVMKSFLKFNKIKTKKNSFSFVLPNNSLHFSEIQEHFNLINKLSSLHVTVVSNTETLNELFFLLKSFKLPLKRNN